MKRFGLLVATLLVGTQAASAHEVWVERDAQGPARVYLGEPAEAVPEGGDPEFHRLQKPVVFLDDPAKAVSLVRRTNHLEADAPGKGDVRVRDDAVFDPWKEGETTQGAIFYARAGRSETRNVLDLELVPVSANADTMTLMFKGKPLADTAVTVISPDRWQKSFKTDAAGVVTVPSLGAGRYILGASHKEAAPGTVAGKPVAAIVHISTLTFVR
ncbi:MAG: nickel uptake transporter family protein [Sphingobium sp.]|nr:MAG: nickel uptake transporter family protein [Sphingobium sp.]